MKNVRQHLLFLVFFFGSAHWAQAQTDSATSAISPRNPVAHSAQRSSSAAPDWLVWRAFHSSLEFYEAQSQGASGRILHYRLSLTDEQSAALANAGQSYLAELSRIEAQTKAAITSRYQSNGVVTPSTLGTSYKGVPGAAEPGVMAAPRKDGRDLYDVLVADGVVASLETQRQEALRAHLAELRKELGGDVVAEIQDWLREDVAPNVAVVTQAQRVPAPAVQTAHPLAKPNSSIGR